jgi:hypothetical protein
LTALLVALALSASATTVSDALADAPPTTGVAVSPPRLDVGVNPSATSLEATFDITNYGNQDETVRLSLVDVYITAGGAYQPLPPRTTPYSLAAQAQLDHDSLQIPPLPSRQATAIVKLSLRLVAPHRPLYGALLVQPQLPTGGATGSPGFNARIAPQVLVPLVTAPLQSDNQPDRLAPSVHLDLSARDLTLGQETLGWLDRLLPFSLPRIADHGSLLASDTVANSGDAYTRSYSHYRFTSAGLLPLLGGDKVFLEVDHPPVPTLPGGLARSGASTRVTTGRSSADSAPVFGLVRVRVTTRMKLVESVTEEVAQEEWILVLPWKELLLGLLALVVVVVVRRLVRRRRGRVSPGRTSEA